MYRTFAVLVAVPLVSLAADRLTTLRQELQGRNTAHPEFDAARDLAAKKPHCFSINSYGNFFPGVNGEKDEAYCRRLEQNFSGTSDDVENAEHSRLVGTATTYAEAYNRYVLAHTTGAEP